MLPSLPSRIQGYQDMKLLFQTNDSYIYITQRDGSPLGEDIVLKFIPLRDRTHKSQIDNECQIQSSIGHAYIMPINTYFDYNDGSQLYRVIEMPLCNKNIVNAYENHSYGGIQHVFRLIIQLSAAIHYLHQNKILHGAICPENIVLKKTNEEFLIPQLTGFQFAKLLSIYSPDTNRCNCRNRIKNFAAPELTQSKSHSYPSDIWALGATFYFIVTGKFVDDQERPNLTFDTQFGPQFPESGRALIARMLNPDPEQRPTSSQILGSDLLEEVNDRGLDSTIMQNKIDLMYKYMRK